MLIILFFEIFTKARKISEHEKGEVDEVTKFENEAANSNIELKKVNNHMWNNRNVLAVFIPDVLSFCAAQLVNEFEVPGKK
jgi:hypothetical protein